MTVYSTHIHTYANTHFFVFGKFHWKEMPNFSENAFAYYSVDMSKLIYVCVLLSNGHISSEFHTHIISAYRIPKYGLCVESVHAGWQHM